MATLEEVTSPEQALRAYYDAINHRQYAHTWLILAPQFKQERYCCEADGSYQFSRYRSWWELVATVEILDTHVQEQQPDAAVGRPRCATLCTADERQRKRIASAWSQSLSPSAG